MALNERVHKLWSVKKVVTISGVQKPSASDEEISDRLKRRGWEHLGRTNRISRAIAEVEANRASVIIVEDSDTLPIQVTLRRLMTNRVALLTPTIVIPSEKNSSERPCFGTMGAPIILDGVPTPSRFVENFEFSLIKWSQDDFLPAFQASQELKAGRAGNCVKLLSQIVTAEVPGTSSVAIPGLALFLRDSNIKAAEKILMGALAKHRKNVGILLSLVDLYLTCAMPGYALRLLKTADATFSQPRSLIPDLLQTHIMMNEVKETIPLFRRMIKDNFLKEVAELYLPRVYYAEGMNAEFEMFVKKDLNWKIIYAEAWSGENKKRATAS